ncbi:hypothetical protein FOL47_009365 [Perkinsus chesapeaki]|uniref:RING-type domain-containing protein n=1 Tax=Perkinsus chesapeaki TaxID=330153 RepID=A0A7J6MRZ6_PERCH|nr:hypothetical protein FOL47_009365 [Perkinsus chesapeaki]
MGVAKEKSSMSGRFERRRREKRERMMLAGQLADKVIGSESCHLPYEEPSPVQLDWRSLPSGLDPSTGCLHPDRAARKREQISGMVAAVLAVIPHSSEDFRPTVVDFGAGSGHLGLLVGYMRADVDIVLVERRPGTCGLARDRVKALGWEDRVEVVCACVQDYEAPCDVGIGLHACGRLTDVIIDYCTRRNCSFVIAGVEGAGAGQLPKSIGEVLTEEEFKTVASLADYSVVHGGGKEGFSYSQRKEYLVARFFHCMPRPLCGGEPIVHRRVELPGEALKASEEDLCGFLLKMASTVEEMRYDVDEVTAAEPVVIEALCIRMCPKLRVREAGGNLGKGEVTIEKVEADKRTEWLGEIGDRSKKLLESSGLVAIGGRESIARWLRESEARATILTSRKEVISPWAKWRKEMDGICSDVRRIRERIQLARSAGKTVQAGPLGTPGSSISFVVDSYEISMRVNFGRVISRLRPSNSRGGQYAGVPVTVAADGEPSPIDRARASPMAASEDDGLSVDTFDDMLYDENNPVRVRETASELAHNIVTLPDLPWSIVVVYGVVVAALTIAAVIVLKDASAPVSGMIESCDTPLPVWIIIFVCRHILKVGMVAARLWLGRHSGHEEAFARMTSAIITCNRLGYYLWLLGCYLVWASSACDQAVWNFAMIMCLIQFIIVGLPVALLFLVMCCLPCLLCLLPVIFPPNANQLATRDDMIRRIPKTEYHRLLEEAGSEGASDVPESCPICLSDFGEDDVVMTLPCNTKHVFHERCITQWLAVSQLCPICRTNISDMLDGGGDSPRDLELGGMG